MVADVHDNLEQRVACQRTHRADAVDDAVERQVLVCVGGQRRFPGPVAHLTQRRVAAQVVAQHQDVDEKPDQLVQFGFGAARRPGVPSGMSTAPARLVQHHGDGGLQQHELGDAQLAAPLGELGAGSGVDTEFDRFAVTAGHWRPGKVGPQPGVLRQPCQLPNPVLSLRTRQPAIPDRTASPESSAPCHAA